MATKRPYITLKCKKLGRPDLVIAWLGRLSTDARTGILYPSSGLVLGYEHEDAATSVALTVSNDTWPIDTVTFSDRLKTLCGVLMYMRAPATLSLWL